MTKIKKGQKYGDWRLESWLGGGGNGSVWLAMNSHGASAAVKILTGLYGRNKEKTYERFRIEVEVVRANADIEGILPILDYFLPEKIGDDVPWYAMPVAQPITSWLSGKTFEAAVDAVLAVGRTLAALHNRGISHRDIKPANLLVLNNDAVLADFGLVDFPEKPDLTRPKENVGAKSTSAPEMRRNAARADGKPADVYSLAKTLWILLSGEVLGFEGQYDPKSVIGLSRLSLMQPERKNFQFITVPALYIKPLEDLLEMSTDHDPNRRPTVEQFIGQLGAWTKIYEDFRKRNPLQWKDLQTALFPGVMPQRAVWENLDDIVAVLNHLGTVDSLNHMLLPGFGGVDLLGARLGSEDGTIELIIHEDTVYVTKPRKLIFENFSSDWQWNYFRLETDQIEPLGIGDRLDVYESLVETSPQSYLSRSEWFDDAPETKRTVKPRFVDRYLTGDFLILQKTCAYNRLGATYDARHAKMTTDEFRAYIDERVRQFDEWVRDERVKQLASDKGLDKSDLAYLYMETACSKNQSLNHKF